ncbi:inactive leucine-rich repeat receptor-like serine/threonine-protein kinase At1g60630 [Curcuma longa]|uniref:inactive leucine-rich repeat receptor-like serine/threonine-protein kinase At1g60630 n=1 Tax=Curcuma longa TaxID=136217 RepID=UPI003D9F208F
MCSFYLCFFFFFLCFSTSFAANVPDGGDIAALLALKNSIDPQGSLPWRRETASGLCGGWNGVKQCNPGGRVTKLVLEFLNLTGTMSPDLLAPLDQLRVLSFKSNSLSGAIPDLSPLVNLKSIYLSDNQFSGQIPANLDVLHRLKVIALSGNLLSGPIPVSLVSLPRLYELMLEDNRLTGQIPAFNQPSLRYLNVSGNDLSGEIPATRALSQFNASSFLDNANLCGAQIGVPCTQKLIFPPSSISPGSSLDHVNAFPPFLPPTGSNHSRRRAIAIVTGSVAGAVFLSICLALALLWFCNRNRRRPVVETRSVGYESGAGRNKPDEEGGAVVGGGGGGRRDKGGFSWEAEGLGKLVFCGAVGEMYSLEELLRASAETLGRGTVGSTYKAVMESGFIVTVKRLKDASRPPAEEFGQRMEELGRLRHPNLVPLRAYFQAKEERLLVYDYFPNGSLFSLIHGSRPSGGGKPLHWTSCLKIAEDVASGLAFLHQTSPVTVHANLKPANVLLGPDFESCLADYALIPALLLHDDAFPSSSSSAAAASSSSLFYRAPEARRSQSFTPLSDVYSFGVLLLELLTGKAPFQDLLEEPGGDVARWVRSVRAEERNDSGEEPGGGSSSGNEAATAAAATAEEKLTALLNIAAACVAAEAERRPAMREVLRMIREARAEAMVVSSNSSDHSPGRWSGTVQSLPREYGSEGFTERD